MVHKIHGRLAVKPSRSQKLMNWPMPKDQTEVRQFLGALGPVRRWIKNCSEICRPLTRLFGWSDKGREETGKILQGEEYILVDDSE